MGIDSAEKDLLLDFPFSLFIRYSSVSTDPRDVPGRENDGITAWVLLHPKHLTLRIWICSL